MRQTEVRVPFERLKDGQTITRENQRIFAEVGRDLKRHECDIEDDHDRRERVYRIDSERRYFFMGGK